MKIIEKLNARQNSLKNPPVTIAFIGDSITQGCFEVYFKNDGNLETVYDYQSSFATRLRELLSLLYPSVQVNIINCGISGDNAQNGFARLGSDVLTHSPDLVVIGYGANDCVRGGKGGESEYAEALRKIFRAVKASGAEAIYVTEGPLCTGTSPHISDPRIVEIAEKFAPIENSGLMQSYFKYGKSIAEAEGVKVCDLYSVWKTLELGGVDITELLANKLNHPNRKFHHYMAIKLLETMFET